MIVQELVRAEQVGSQFEDALEQLGDIEGMHLALDAESVVAPLREPLRAMRRRRSRV